MWRPYGRVNTASGTVASSARGGDPPSAAAGRCVTLPMSTCRSFDVAGWLDGGWSAVVEELVDGEQFAAWAVAAGADPAAGPVAVGTPLVGEVAGLAVAALVVGGLAAEWSARVAWQ